MEVGMRALIAVFAALALGGAPAAAPAPPAPPAPTRAPGSLSVQVTNHLDDLALGQPVRYMITVGNRSDAPQRLTVRVATPALLRNVQGAGAQFADGVLAWPVLVPANGQSTMELRGTVGQLKKRSVTRMSLTVCGLPDGANTRMAAPCATDIDGLLVRGPGSVALPWMAAAVLAALVATVAAQLWRRRRTSQP
jgi:hypothetical protein